MGAGLVDGLAGLPDPQEFAAGSAATRCTSGGRGSPPNFTKLFVGDLTAARNPAGQKQLSSSRGAPSSYLQQGNQASLAYSVRLLCA